MAYYNSVLSQVLKYVPRLEFEKAANAVDGKRRSDALSRRSQFVALAIGQLSGRHSVRDIEATLRTQRRRRSSWTIESQIYGSEIVLHDSPDGTSNSFQ